MGVCVEEHKKVKKRNEGTFYMRFRNYITFFRVCKKWEQSLLIFLRVIYETKV